MANPYVIDGAIEDPGMFFGRRVHLRRLLRHVREMDCASVVGPPSIGRSSLLYQRAHQAGLKDTHLSVYLDLSDTALQSPPGFVACVMEALGRQTSRELTGSSIDQLERALTVLREEDELYVLLCLDDFHEFAAAPEIDYAFLDELRRLGFARLLSIVVASLHPLEDLVRQADIRRFLGLFDGHFDLGLLSAGEADQLIRDLALRGELELPAEALEMARELGGRHPLYLQLAGHHLVEQILSTGEMDLQAVRERFAEAAFPYLQRLWAYLGAQEREASRYYAGAADIRPPSMGTRQGLMRKGVVERGAGEYRLFTEHFREVVQGRRRDLEGPLPVPEEPPALTDVQTPTPEEPTGEVGAPSEPQATVPEQGVVEAAVAQAAEAPTPEQSTPEATTAPVEAEPEVPAAPPPPVAVEPRPSEGPSPREVSSLSALGCYVLAITLDLMLIAGIVVARLFFRLPTREMYILVGISAILPVVFLFLGRLGGGLWARVFAWVVRRL
jgi:hypothetical protein